MQAIAVQLAGLPGVSLKVVSPVSRPLYTGTPGDALAGASADYLRNRREFCNLRARTAYSRYDDEEIERMSEDAVCDIVAPKGAILGYPQMVLELEERKRGETKVEKHC